MNDSRTGMDHDQGGMTPELRALSDQLDRLAARDRQAPVRMESRLVASSVGAFRPGPRLALAGAAPSAPASRSAPMRIAAAIAVTAGIGAAILASRSTPPGDGPSIAGDADTDAAYILSSRGSDQLDLEIDTLAADAANFSESMLGYSLLDDLDLGGESL